MPDNVIILGAGASRDSGAPLLDDFIDKAEDLLRNKMFENGEPVQRIFELINELQVVYSKSNVDLNNI